jgi:glycosyltransferase involved in cell wall biosynthesis
VSLNVNIVVGNADMNWIAGRFARELVARLPKYGVEAKINGSKADLEYQQIVYGPPDTRPAVGLFTHGDFRPKWYSGDYDGHITLNSVMAAFCRSGGAKNPVVIGQVVDERFVPKDRLVFGIVGRTYSDGRKGEALVQKMVDAGYDVRAMGSGWPCPTVPMNLDELPNFYRTINYYVDTSNDEGGCVPAFECMAMGIPVISHTVGVDRPVIPYERNSWASLEQVLYKLTHPRTYEDWAREHAEYFLEVMK